MTDEGEKMFTKALGELTAIVKSFSSISTRHKELVRRAVFTGLGLDETGLPYKEPGAKGEGEGDSDSESKKVSRAEDSAQNVRRLVGEELLPDLRKRFGYRAK